MQRHLLKQFIGEKTVSSIGMKVQCFLPICRETFATGKYFRDWLFCFVSPPNTIKFNFIGITKMFVSFCIGFDFYG